MFHFVWLDMFVYWAIGCTVGALILGAMGERKAVLGNLGSAVIYLAIALVIGRCSR